MNHDFGQPRCRCTEERLDHESDYAREILFDLYMRQAEMEFDDVDEIYDRANELLREME